MMRHSVPDIVEAGRELGRFDSRPWLAPLPIPTAVVLTHATTRSRRASSTSSPPRSARRCSTRRSTTSRSNEQTVYNPVLLRALSAVGGRESAAAA